MPPLDLTGTVHTVYYAPDTIDSKLIGSGGAPHTCTHAHAHINSHMGHPPYMHTFTCAHLHMCTPSHVHTFTCAHLHMCTPSHVHTFTCAHLHMCTPSHVHTFTCAHLHVHTFTCAHLHICTPSHVRTSHTCTCTCTPSQMDIFNTWTPSHIPFMYSPECDKIGHKKISVWTVKIRCCC